MIYVVAISATGFEFIFWNYLSYNYPSETEYIIL